MRLEFVSHVSDMLVNRQLVMLVLVEMRGWHETRCHGRWIRIGPRRWWWLWLWLHGIGFAQRLNLNRRSHYRLRRVSLFSFDWNFPRNRCSGLVIVIAADVVVVANIEFFHSLQTLVHYLEALRIEKLTLFVDSV